MLYISVLMFCRKKSTMLNCKKTIHVRFSHPGKSLMQHAVKLHIKEKYHLDCWKPCHLGHWTLISNKRKLDFEVSLWKFKNTFSVKFAVLFFLFLCFTLLRQVTSNLRSRSQSWFTLPKHLTHLEKHDLADYGVLIVSGAINKAPSYIHR